jgi:hypothetical protein
MFAFIFSTVVMNESRRRFFLEARDAQIANHARSLSGFGRKHCCSRKIRDEDWLSEKRLLLYGETSC